MPDLQERSAVARSRRSDDHITAAARLKLRKEEIAYDLELARLKQEERKTRRSDRRNDAALAIAILLTLVAAVTLPSPVWLLLALLWLRAAVQLQRAHL